jgi:hypothetical protein
LKEIGAVVGVWRFLPEEANKAALGRGHVAWCKKDVEDIEGEGREEACPAFRGEGLAAWK